MESEAQTAATRWSLIRRVVSPECDDTAWAEFYGLYRGLVYGVARRSGLSHDEAEDAVQETMSSLGEKFRTFDADPEGGSFRGWLLRIARWRIADVIRDRPVRKEAPPDGGDESRATATEDRLPDPASADFEVLWEEQWKQSLVTEATARVRQRVSPEQFQIFDFYVLREMPVRRVAQSLGVSVASVYLARHRILRLIRREARRLRESVP